MISGSVLPPNKILMKVGDLIKYSEFPHRELQHLVGIVAALSSDQYDRDELDMVWVMWGHDRPQGPRGSLLEEFIDDLEVISESR